MSNPVIPPGAWLGLLGGGQLGRMFCMAAQSLGYRVAVLDPGSESPAGSVANRHIQADYLNQAALKELASFCQAVTTEFENVPAQSLDFLAMHCVVSPSAASVAVAQDRIAEKAFIEGCGLQVAPYVVINSTADLEQVPNTHFPAILKVSRMGYDGKGQASVATREEACAAFEAIGGEGGPQPCVLEKRVPLMMEMSVVVARDSAGKSLSYPPSENVHRDGILALSRVPARSAHGDLQDRAIASAHKIADALEYVGVLCVEFFVPDEGMRPERNADNTLLVNEIAPRPHNSGHYTIDACITSQFQQQVRILAGMPLGDTRMHSSSVMLNILGDLWFDADGNQREPDWVTVLRHPEANLHLYGKREPRRGRKMGHITITGPNRGWSRRIATHLSSKLGLPPLPDWV